MFPVLASNDSGVQGKTETGDSERLRWSNETWHGKPKFLEIDF